MYQHILVPTDGRDGTRRAITQALDLAATFDGTVHALTVINEPQYTTSGGGNVPDSIEQFAERAVDRVERDAKKRDIPVRRIIRRGFPADEILEYATEADVDAIVMGTHGRTGFDRLIIGSVTERVIRAAEVPVITVRMRDEISITDPSQAEAIALEVLDDDGYETTQILEHPYRTSASWVVPVETESGVGQIHVDAVTGTARIGMADRD